MSAAFFVCRPDYAHYVAEVVARLVALDVPCVILSPEEARAQVERLRGGAIVATIHSVLAAVRDLMADLAGRVPTLTLQDGIIEYRHAHHVAAGGILRYRPLQTDRIAVFGERSATLLRAFGVEDARIAVTGSCRIAWAAPPPAPPGDGVLLITAANRPAFDAEGTVRFYRLLDRLLATCTAQAIPFRLRLSRGLLAGKGLCRIEGVADRLDPDLVRRFRAAAVSTATLAEDIAAARAVLTTPSTVSLEAMAAGRPVGHILFDDETAFLNPAWTIGPGSDIAAVIADMFAPGALKLIYQDAVLRENLMPGDAVGRIVDLIRTTIAGRGAP